MNKCVLKSPVCTIEFEDFFIILSTNENLNSKINLIEKKTNLKGRKVKDGFEYSSINNKDFLNVEEIKKSLKTVY